MEFHVTVPDCTTVSTHCKACPSTALASVITAIATALLATVISVLVSASATQSRFMPGGAETGTSAEGVWHKHEEVDEGRGGVAVSDPTYMEVDGRQGGNTFQLLRKTKLMPQITMYIIRSCRLAVLAL